MKKWITPEVSELNISETANGLINYDIEFWPFVNDKNGTPPDIDHTS